MKPSACITAFADALRYAYGTNIAARIWRDSNRSQLAELHRVYEEARLRDEKPEGALQRITLVFHGNLE